jgi:hypothetical protein
VITDRTSNPVRQIITSGRENESVPDESFFRQQFVEALRGQGDTNGDNYITGAELGEFLYNAVTNYSRGTQRPQYGKIRDPNLDKGDFVFKLPTPSPPNPPDEEFCITHIVIKDSRGNTIEPLNSIYTINQDEAVTIIVEFTNPYEHNIDVIWTTDNYGGISPFSRKLTPYTAENLYMGRNSDRNDIIINVLDKDTGLEKSIHIQIQHE